MLIVPQLWLWKIDSRTIITTCHERRHGGDESANETLFKGLRRGLEDMEQYSEGTTPLDCFIAFAVQHCISFFNLTLNSGLKDAASWLFARYIALQSRKEAEFRQTFLDSLEQRYKSKSFAVARLDIRDEIKCLREVKDIRDEVNMIQNILGSQMDVFSDMISSFKRQLEQSDTKHDFGKMDVRMLAEKRQIREVLNQVTFDRTIDTLCQRWKALDEDAERVERSEQLNHLLDLKQKQANLDEAASASEESKTAAVQNQAVLVFTIVTVIFTPLSFVTSLYALDYFKPANDDDVAHVSGWGQNDIGKALGVAEGITLAALILVIGYAIFHSSLSPRKSKSQTATRQAEKKQGTEATEVVLLNGSIQKPAGVLSVRWSSPIEGRSSRKARFASSASPV